SDSPGWVETYELLRGIPQHRYVKNGYGATANLAVSRQTFMHMGGFDVLRFSGSDAEVCRRAATLGGSVRFVRNAVVEHPARAQWAEVVTKTRRIKGAQARTKGLTLARWFCATLIQPLRGGFNFMAADAPLSQKLKALMVHWALWPIEL